MNPFHLLVAYVSVEVVRVEKVLCQKWWIQHFVSNSLIMLHLFYFGVLPLADPSYSFCVNLNSEKL